MSTLFKTTTCDKIKSLEEVAAFAASMKATGKRLVQCHGVFDLIHPGHIKHLEAAKKEGEVLIVTLTPDVYVNKGPGRPFFNQRLRAESLAALECVDAVAVNEWPTAVEAICLLKPDVYVKGSEYANPEQDITGQILDEERAVLEGGGRIHFTDEITFSSSHLINRQNDFHVFPPVTETWLKAFRKKYSLDQILNYLDIISHLKVLIVGEAIIDEYVFCQGLGMSSKDPILACRYILTETYPGGCLAVANHAAGFCPHTGLVTLLGDSERREDYVRDKLLQNIQVDLITRRNAPTIHKRRFVDNYSGVKLFELYMMEDTPLEADDQNALVNTLNKVIQDYDVVIVSDFGHGMLTSPVITSVCEQARFLALMTQANAGNHGFNTISRYPRADYVCLAMHEISLETKMRHANWRDLVLEVIKRIECPRFTVTQGEIGTLHYEPQCGFTQAPAFATRVVDRVGAGDAVLALTSLLVAVGAPWDVVGFFANIAGAEMVSQLGNKIAVSRISVTRHITSLLK